MVIGFGNGVFGGKAYVMFRLLKNSKGLATCGSRVSTQIKTATLVCEKLNIPCHIFMPKGESKVREFIEQHNAIIHYGTAGYNSVINANARDYAKENNLDYIPLGMLNDTCINIISDLVIENKELFSNIKRLVIPIGSGCFFTGIVNGLCAINYNGEILGVMCGMDATKNIQKYLCLPLEYLPNMKIVKSTYKYEDLYANNLDLNETYEAKCLDFMSDGDTLLSIAK